MELVTLLLAAIIFLITFIWFHRRAGSNLPPSPMQPLPIVGHLFFMARDFRPLFKKWRKRCGDIYSLYMGGTLVVVLNGYDLIKEALVTKGDVFSDRPPYFINEVLGVSNKGIILSSGENWKEQRSVAMSILRSFGMGKNLLAEKIQVEVNCYLNYLASLKGAPTNIRVMTSIGISNIICSTLIGNRFEYDDKDFQNLIHKLDSLFANQQNVSLNNFFFWLKYLPGDLFMAKTIASDAKAIMDVLARFIEEKRRLVDDFKEANNLIDAYDFERNKKIQAGICSSMDDDNLKQLMADLFAAGSETTSSTVDWCILYMINYPKIQEQVYSEIKDKVGTDRTPTIQDKSKLTYLNAVIMETQRLASIVALSVTHMCSKEVSLRGYTLPKGTYIIPNLDSVLHDKTFWGDDVMSFRPERFIDDHGKLKNPEQFIPFSIGRRGCLGEAMAKMELFLFLSSMIQRFQFLPPSQSFVPELNAIYGMVVYPIPYEVRMVERM